MSIPPIESVSEEDESVQVCATLSSDGNIERSFIATSSIFNGTG